MVLKISTLYKISPEKFFDKLLNISSLIYVASPVLKFTPVSPKILPKTWTENQPMTFKLYFLGIIPLGEHIINIKLIDAINHKIISNESDAIAKKWNHVISIENRDGYSLYTDMIDIDAGVLTIFVWIFAFFFYKHRQRKWGKVIRESF